MWKWIAEVWKEGDSVDRLKAEWRLENGFDNYSCNCFFCFYANNVGCDRCPGRLVSEDFFCMDNDEFDWRYHPKAFYAKIHELYQIAKEKYGWEAV